MKRLLYSTALMMFFLIGSQSVFAKGKNDVEKRKVVERDYQVDEDVLLMIENKFGKVHVNTWEKPEIQVRIEIIARRRSESRAQELLDRIEVDIDESSSVKRFETDISGSISSKNSESFEINYTVNMPLENPLDIKNSFGDVYIGDLDGNSKVKVSYGDLQAKKLMGRCNLKLSFGNGEIEEVSSGELDVKYSNLDIEKVGNIRLEQGFSELKIKAAESIDLKSKYGEIELGAIRGIRGYVGFTDFSIENLMVELDLETSYAGGFEIERVAKGFRSINLEGKFGSYKIGFETGTNATFETRLKFSDFRYSELNVDLNYKLKEDFRSEYRGKLGNGEGGSVKIVSSYGDVRFY